MKAFFSNRVVVIMALCCLALVSCGDDVEDPALEDGCVLNKIEFIHNGVPDGSMSLLEYNAQGYVIKASEQEGLGSQAVVFSIRNFVYNDQNQLIRDDFWEDSGNEIGYDLYEYNPDGTVSQMTEYNNGNLDFVVVYSYDANKRIIQSVETSQGQSFKTVYEYIGSSDNVARKLYYDNDDQEQGITTYEDYDDKLNPVQTLKGLATGAKRTVLIGESRNNYRKETFTYDGVVQRMTNYAYQYNTSGYVTEMIEMEVGSQDEYKSVFAYSGCE